jgi:serine/threonine-protein kinase
VAPAVATDSAAGPLVIGRYALFDAIGSGGMATVHIARRLDVPSGTVAVKRLHPHLNAEPDLMTMFMDEVRIVERIVHPNVVRVVDVVRTEEGLILVMEYIHGESLSLLRRSAAAAGEAVPIPIATAIVHGVLLGLHGAHETTGPDGALLGVVHRDVSPQNVIVGADGIARVLDFGVAKATGRTQVTRQNQVKGKLAYMSPEQIRGLADRRADIFAASVVLWEVLTGRRLHEGIRDVEIVTRVVRGMLPSARDVRTELTPELDQVIMRGLAANPNARYATAREMADDLVRCAERAPAATVAAWVERLATPALADRAEKIRAMDAAVATMPRA